MYQKWVTLMVFLCFILFIYRYNYLFSRQNQLLISTSHRASTNEIFSPGDFINIGFSLYEFEQAKLRENQLQNEYNISAILLHWNELENMKNTLKYLLKMKFFKEIIIWNNNPEINLTIDNLTNNNHTKQLVYIINSKENVKEIGKYYGCIKSRSQACFYINNDLYVFKYLKSILSNFRSNPNVYHILTSSSTFYKNFLFNSFHDDQFQPFSSANLFLRKHAEQYLPIQNKSINFKNILFSIWFYNVSYKHSTVASSIFERSLDQNLFNNDPVNSSDKQDTHFSYYLKSASFHNDFIFYTNMHPFKIANISQTWPMSHNIWKATDGIVLSCWYSYRNIQSNDFFAIDFLRAQSNITFLLTFTHSLILQENLDIKISFDGLWWISYRSLKGIFIKKSERLQNNIHTILFDSSQFTLGFQAFRYISFQTLKPYNHRFQICDIKMIPKNNILDLLYHLQ